MYTCNYIEIVVGQKACTDLQQTAGWSHDSRMVHCRDQSAHVSNHPETWTFVIQNTSFQCYISTNIIPQGVVNLCNIVMLHMTHHILFFLINLSDSSKHFDLPTFLKSIDGSKVMLQGYKQEIESVSFVHILIIHQMTLY